MSVNGYRVLVVDDDRDFAQSLCNILQLDNCITFIANDHVAALNEAASAMPDLALIDIRLGKGNGIDLVKQLVARFPGLICIVMTGYASIDSAIAALKQDAYDYLRKPFDMDELGTTLKRCFEKLALRNEKSEIMASLEKRNAEIENLNQELERRVEHRTAELRTVQKELIRKAHIAGMAEISTSILHNVGNILNSVTTSSQIVHEAAASPAKLNAIAGANKKLAELIEANATPDKQDLVQLGEFLNRFEKLLHKEQSDLQHHSQRTITKIEMIKEAILSQQSYATAGFQTEEVLLDQVIDQALAIHEFTLCDQQVEVVKDYALAAKVIVQKHKLLHVLTNLFKNAWEAMSVKKKITISIAREGEQAVVRLLDNGSGIKHQNLSKIFQYGFTTKETGTGAGLHSCANAMKEMNGSIWAESEGEGKGALFGLRFPLA